MTIENGAAMAANDTALRDQTDEAPEEAEVDYGGKTYTLPAELKDALLRQADYTRKTQEVAQGRKTLDAARADHDRRVMAMRAHFSDAARVMALNDQLRPFAQVDWQALKAQDPARAQGLWQQCQQIKNLRDHAARAWTQRDQDHTGHAQRETAKRARQVHAHLPQLIADWSPELDAKLTGYGTAQGLSREEMAQATLQNPAFVKLLHKAHQHDDTVRKKNTQQIFDAAQAARPVTRVGGNGGTASRRTTDSSGDALSTEEWAKRERERLRKR